MSGETNSISKELYLFFLEIGVPYEGFVEDLGYVMRKIVMVATAFNPQNHHFYTLHSIPIEIRDTGKVNDSPDISPEYIKKVLCRRNLDGTTSINMLDGHIITVPSYPMGGYQINIKTSTSHNGETIYDITIATENKTANRKELSEHHLTAKQLEAILKMNPGATLPDLHTLDLKKSEMEKHYLEIGRNAGYGGLIASVAELSNFEIAKRSKYIKVNSGGTRMHNPNNQPITIKLFAKYAGRTMIIVSIGADIWGAAKDEQSWGSGKSQYRYQYGNICRWIFLSSGRHHNGIFVFNMLVGIS
jgi:hypothetical protein